jgi:hypothetical protein
MGLNITWADKDKTATLGTGPRTWRDVDANEVKNVVNNFRASLVDGLVPLSELPDAAKTILSATDFNAAGIANGFIVFWDQGTGKFRTKAEANVGTNLDIGGNTDVFLFDREVDGDEVTLLIGLEDQLAGRVLIAPATETGTPTFRRLVVSDIPGLEGFITAQAVASVQTIADLNTFVRGDIRTVIVRDDLRGGTFTYIEQIDFVGVPDNGISFTAQDGGYWVRLFDGKTVYARWFDIGTHIADNKSNTQNAFETMKNLGGGELIFPPGQLNFTSQNGLFYDSSNLTITGSDGGTTLNFTDLQFVNGIRRTGIIFEGSRNVAVYTFDSNLTKNTVEIPISSSEVLSSLSVKQTILLRSDASFNIERTFAINGYDYNKGEFITIRQINESSITLDAPLKDSYLYEDGLYLDTFDFVENIKVKNIKINTNFPTQLVYGMSFEFFKNVSVENCNIINSGFAALYFTTGLNALAKNNQIEDCLEATLGYGVYFLGVYNGRALENNFNRVRHGVDVSGQSNRGYVPSRNIIISKNDVLASIRAGLSTHGGCEYVTISENKVTGCNEGIISRGPNASIINNQIYTCKGIGIFTGIQVGETITADKGRAGENVKISGNRIHDSPSHAISFFTPMLNVLISDNEILRIGQGNSGGNNNGMSIRSSTIRNLRIENNTIDCLGAISSIGSGISINPANTDDGSNQEDVLIKNNTIKVPTTGSPRGIRIAGNSANTTANLSKRIRVEANNINGGNTPIEFVDERFYSKIKIVDNILDGYTTSESGAISFPTTGFPTDHPVVIDNWFKVGGLGYQGVALSTSNKPAYGVWRQGTRIYDRDPVIGSNTGWVFTGSEFQSMGRLADYVMGVYTTDGNGSATNFTFTHALGRIPAVVLVTPISLDAGGAFYISSRTTTQITITYDTARPAGTGNLSWSLNIQ